MVILLSIKLFMETMFWLHVIFIIYDLSFPFVLLLIKKCAIRIYNKFAVVLSFMITDYHGSMMSNKKWKRQLIGKWVRQSTFFVIWNTHPDRINASFVNKNFAINWKERHFSIICIFLKNKWHWHKIYCLLQIPNML